MASIRDEDLDKFEIGDVFYECEMGMNIEARFTSKPVSHVEQMHDGPRTQWTWTAENTQNGQVINYLLTEGLSHYGPRLYTQPEYVRVGRDGEWSFPLVGAPE